MKIVCDSCGAKYSIADEKVAGKIFKIRCKKCSSVLEVRGDQTGAHPFGEASSPQDQGGEPTWYIVVDGEQQGPLRPIELSQLFAKGSVGLDSYVWKEGFDDWKAAGDVPELTQVLGGAAASKKSPAAATDDTSSFGTGGDLFSDRNGREPTSEIDTSGNMFAGFDESPTPTGAQDSPFAAASDDSGATAGVAGFGGGAMGGSAPQRMTGQRNENSVLFSLTNLQQLASRGGAPSGAAPAAASQPSASAGAQLGPQAAGEGSGLIDIRALAKSTTPGTRSAPSQAVDDLLAIGTGGGAALGTPLLGPAPLDTSDGNRWLWIGGAAIAVIAIVGAGVGVGMVLGGSEDDALEITAAAEPEPARPIRGSNEVATAAQAPADPPEQALAAEEPIEAATLEERVEAAPEIGEPEPPTKRTSSSSQRRQRTSTRTEAAKPAPAPKTRSGNNLDALMDEVVGGAPSSAPKQTAKSSSPSDSSLPDAPSRDDVKTALQGVSGAVKGCRKDAGGTAAVNVV
ncbi:MAG: DUF4339 domain-containing protein, partial [Myxococcales bacterium]